MKTKLCLYPDNYAPALCIPNKEHNCWEGYHYNFKHLEEDLDIKLSRNLKRMIFRWNKKCYSWHIYPKDYDIMHCDTDWGPEVNKSILKEFVKQGYKIANVLKSELPDFEIYYNDIILKDDVLIEGE